MVLAIRLAFFIGVLIFLSYYDLRHGIVPNKITYPAILATIGLNLLSPDASIEMSLIGGVVLAALLMIPSLLFRRMGLGDVKLAFLIGLMTGFPEGIIALFGGIFVGGIWAIILVLLKIKRPKDEMPYAPFLATGAIAVLLGGQRLLYTFL